STWPADEAVLLPALKMVRTEVATLRTIIAPHEPTESRVASLLSKLRRDGWRAETLGRVEAEGSAEGIDAVVVDRVGVLAHLYAVGSVSYVGGGFHGDGLHSVLEPAAAATPIVFGPQHHNARAAEDLVTAGGAKIAQDADALAREVQHWLTDEVECDRTGRLSRGYIDVHLGAAGRTAELLDGLIAPLSDFDSNA
ncbi:MAG: 3-deoxy-D-manno-octulosonic acid transferase, partial [Longimicrobiales bacterium]